MNEDYSVLYGADPQKVPEEPMYEKPAAEYARYEQLAAMAALFLGFLFVRFVWYHTNGLTTTIFYWLLFTAELVFIKKGGVKLRLSEKLNAAVLYLFSTIYTITSNGTLRGMTTVFLLLVSCLLLFSVGNPEKDIYRFLPMALGKAAVASPIANFGKAFSAAASQKRSKSFWRNFLYIAGGLFIAFPLTCIVATLLCSADEGMSALLGKLIRIPPEDILILVPHLVVGALIGCAVFSCMYRSVHRTEAPGYDLGSCENSVLSLRIMPNPMVYAAVTPVCILYILYIVSQLNYFLGGFTGNLSSGYTYAEYAREGFFQLCAVCCINLAVICIMSFGAKITGIVKPVVLRIYTMYLCICSLFIAGTAVAKMIMYIRVYGMTQLRIYTTWFMLLLCIGFVVILIRQFLPMLPIGKIGYTAFVLMFGLLCFSRPDDWMIRYNAEMYLSGQLEEFDEELLYSMSDDAWAAISCYSLEAFGNELPDTFTGTLDAAVWKAGKDFYSWQNLSSWILLYGRQGV